MSESRRPAAEPGFSLLEVLIAVVVLSVGVLALGAAAMFSLRDMNRSRRDTQYWADVQQVTDSLLGVGWNVVVAGSTTIRGRAMSWTVTTVNSKSQKVRVLVSHSRYTNPSATVQDTVLLYLASPNP